MADAYYWRVDVTYPYQFRQNGYDDKLRKAAGVHSDDSGAGFGQRDIGWVHEVGDGGDELRAKEMGDRLRQLNLEGVDVDVYSLKKDE